ncbi:MAG: SAM-dependent methyltransferase [Rhodospirillaceae bacterium]|nr:SAM-dependent methyltransferase [Rhodospirillaceae bacterium]|tara:strand:- start:4010 stop:4615 length:606 start_codon:yes stop_codon:yes gene_type:complete
MDDARLHVPAAQRNGEAILKALEGFHRTDLKVLEIASGPGQHCALFAAAWPDTTWQPSDPDARMRASQSAWTDDLDNVRAPVSLDVTDDGWWKAVQGPFDLMLCTNMLHCSGRETMEGLMAGAAGLLADDGRLLIYGPFMFNGLHSADSNRSFDHMMRQQNPNWGVRDLNDIAAAGQVFDVAFDSYIEMPANNHILVFRKA